MDLKDLANAVKAALLKSSTEVDEAMARAALDACDPSQSTTEQNKLRHPDGSSTPLPDAHTRAIKRVASLEAKHKGLIRDATVALMAIDYANRHLDRVQLAVEADRDKKRDEGSNGTYLEIKEYIDRLYSCGATKWDLKQQALEDIRIEADLIRWKAFDPLHKDKSSPWPALRAFYRGRNIPIDALQKQSLSQPVVAQQLVPPGIITPEVEDKHLRDWIDGWATSAPDNNKQSVAVDVERPSGSGAYGGIIAEEGLPPRVVPMWARKERNSLFPNRSGLDGWYHFEVPRGPYVVLHRANMATRYSPPVDDMFPPYPSVRTFAVLANFTHAECAAVERAGRGEGGMTSATAAVAFYLSKINRSGDELLRAWMFLLVGRRNMDRIDELFPENYFHGVRFPDAGAADSGFGSFEILRVSSEPNLPGSLRNSLVGPWARRSAGEEPKL